MKILVAYDGSPSVDAAVVDLQKAGIPKEAEALVFFVVASGISQSDVPDFPVAASRQPSKVELDDAKALANNACKWIQSHFPDWKVSIHVSWGSPAEMILDKIDFWRPDLLVVGSHGRSLAGRFLHGSISLKLTHDAHCSVRVVRSGTQFGDGPNRIVVGCDGSPESEAVILEVSRRSWPEKTAIRIVSVFETILPIADVLEPSAYTSQVALAVIHETLEQQRTRIHEIVEKSREQLQRADLIVTAAEVEGDPKHELVAEANRWSADTVFVDARGLGRLEQVLLGSVSTAVVKHAHCTVEIVRR